MLSDPAMTMKTIPIVPLASGAPVSRHTVEGIARVVDLVDGVAWLEPEQTTSCGHCASSASCGHGEPGIGTIASRIELRRFPVDGAEFSLCIGDRVVVGIDNRALLKGTLLAYMLPLLTALVAGGFAQDAWASDAATMGCMVAGLALGLLVARFGARRLSRRGELAPRVLRRARPDETCSSA
jgi:sigma-E factor negative regulatory protein RseC